MHLKKSILFFLIFMYSFSIKAQTADEIISGYIHFIGGEKQWKSIRTIISSGTYNYGGIAFPFTSYSKAPDLYKFVVPFKGKYYAQSFNGKTGWKIDAFKNETKRTLLTGKAALAMANEADVELESAFINYKNKGFKAIAEGEDSVEKFACFKIKFIKTEGDTGIYFFNKENFSLVKKSAASKNEEMQNKVLDTYFDDYRNTEGVKIPFKSTSKSGDQTILTITIDKIQINTFLPDKDFQ